MKKEKIIAVCLAISLIANVILVINVTNGGNETSDKAWELLSLGTCDLKNIEFENLEPDIFGLRYNEMLEKFYASSHLFLLSKKEEEHEIGRALTSLIKSMSYPPREIETKKYVDELYEIFSVIEDNRIITQEQRTRLNEIEIELISSDLE